jgi:membrane associated rhomboid family serine protease
MSSPDLFVVCKNCQAEVSPYITECPYCGTRLRKRAPRIERPDAPVKPAKRGPRVGGRNRATSRPKQPRAAPHLGKLRSGEIPGIRGDEHARPYATIVLVALSLGLWLSLPFIPVSQLTIRTIGYEAWFYLSASLINDGTAAMFAAVVGVGLFGWLIERRRGPIAVVLLFLLCGPAAIAAALAVDPGALVFGTHGAGLGLLCAWLVPVLLERQRTGGDDDTDLLGVLVIAAVLALVPLISQGSALAAVFGAAFGALAGVLFAAADRRSRA